MGAADHGGPFPDLYQLLGVRRGASGEEIAQAWRRRARAEHPDSRPADATAPGRFRAVAEAYQVLSDPARRAAYDRVLGCDQPGPGAGAPGPRRVSVTPMTGAPGPPLWAGPVRMEGGPRRAPAPGGWEEQEITLAVLAELALRYLARDWDQPW